MRVFFAEFYTFIVFVLSLIFSCMVMDERNPFMGVQQKSLVSSATSFFDNYLGLYFFIIFGLFTILHLILRSLSKKSCASYLVSIGIAGLFLLVMGVLWDIPGDVFFTTFLPIIAINFLTIGIFWLFVFKTDKFIENDDLKAFFALWLLCSGVFSLLLLFASGIQQKIGVRTVGWIWLELMVFSPLYFAPIMLFFMPIFYVVLKAIKKSGLLSYMIAGFIFSFSFAVLIGSLAENGYAIAVSAMISLQMCIYIFWNKQIKVTR